MKHVCYVCQEEFEGNYKVDLSTHVAYCVGCRREVLGAGGDPTGARVKEPFKCSLTDQKLFPIVERLRATKALVNRVDEGHKKAGGSWFVDPDSEEERLRNILTRPANKDYCMCGIHRDRCDYHRPQAPKLEKRPGGEGVMTYYDALGNPHKAVFRDGVWFEVT